MSEDVALAGTSRLRSSLRISKNDARRSLTGFTIEVIMNHEYKKRNNKNPKMQKANAIIIETTVLLIEVVVSVDVFSTSLLGTVANTVYCTVPMSTLDDVMRQDFPCFVYVTDGPGRAPLNLIGFKTADTNAVYSELEKPSAHCRVAHEED